MDNSERLAAAYDTIMAMEELSVAADDQGVLSFADLAELGWTDQTIRRAVASGRLTRLSRGWFAVGLPTDPTAEHLVRLRAVERAFQETAVASHHSELLRLGLPAYAADLSVVHLCRSDPTKQGRRRRGVMVHSPVPAAAIEDRRLLPAVAVAQHAVAVGAQGGLAAADAGLRTGLLTAEGLDDAFGLVGAHRDIPMLRALMRFADARSESVGESRLRLIVHLMRLEVIPQFEVRDGSFVARADLGLRDHPVLLKFDGFVKYRRAAATDGWRAGRDELVAEKVREDRLRALGFTVVRVTWHELDDPDQVAKTIRAAIKRATVSKGATERLVSAQPSR